MQRTDIINGLIRDRGYTSYLEIGIGTGENFKSIECKLKDGVDPFALLGSKPNNLIEIEKNGFLYIESSDDFFIKNNFHYDLIFIDGLHHSDQVERDILNSWNCLKKGGIILIHNIRPFNELTQRVPRESEAWMGDVWRAWYGLKTTYPKLNTYFLEERAGIGAIEKSRHKIDFGFVDLMTSYEYYDRVKGWE